MPLGNKVRQARERPGWTMQVLAGRAGLSQPYVSEIENNNKRPSARSVMKLAAVLNVPGEYLLRDDVKTLSELEIEAAMKNKIDRSKYFPYFVTVDEAIAAGVTPEEISYAIQFIVQCKSGHR